MDGSNVNEENICFSSARNLFENSELPKKPSKIQLQKSSPSPHLQRTGFKDRNSDCKGSAVISTATLKRQQRTDQIIDDNDDNSNNNNNATPVSSGDRKTEISVLKINASSKAIKTTSLTKGPTILKSDSSAFKTSQNKILAPFPDKNENVVKEGMIIITAIIICHIYYIYMAVF